MENRASVGARTEEVKHELCVCPLPPTHTRVGKLSVYFGFVYERRPPPFVIHPLQLEIQFKTLPTRRVFAVDIETRLSLMNMCAVNV